jgi:hypothetical protein
MGLNDGSIHALVGVSGALAAMLTAGAARAQTVTVTQTGDITANFIPVGHPGGAAKIAACSETTIYALNYDHTLWVSQQGGADWTWQYLTTPGGVDSMACDGQTLIVLNYDKTVWRYVAGPDGKFEGWLQYATAGGAMQLGGGPGVLTALNFDQSFWTSVGNDSSTFPGQWWTERGVPEDAARITGSVTGGQFGRFFALNYDGSFWLNDNVIAGGVSEWKNFTSGLPEGVVGSEISAAGPAQFFLLDDKNELWSVIVAEVAWTTLSQNVNYTFPGDVALGGSSSVTFGNDGTVQFSASFHDSGAEGYDVSATCTLTDANNTAYTIEAACSTNGTFGGHGTSRDCSWNATTTNIDVRNAWGAIVNGRLFGNGSIQCSASENANL